MRYDIEVKIKGTWLLCGRYSDPQRALHSLETVHPGIELRAIPVFETKYLCG